MSQTEDNFEIFLGNLTTQIRVYINQEVEAEVGRRLQQVSESDSTSPEEHSERLAKLKSLESELKKATRPGKAWEILDQIKNHKTSVSG